MIGQILFATGKFNQSLKKYKFIFETCPIKLKQIYDSQEFKEILQKDAGAGDGKTLRDVLSTYEKEMQINNAVVAQAEANKKKQVMTQQICIRYKLMTKVNLN